VSDSEADPEPEPEPEPADDGQPDLSESETADLDGLDLDPDDLDPADGEDDSDGEPADDSGSESSDSEGEATASQPEPVSGGDWGEMYVSVLTQTTNSIIEKHGDGETVDEDHFRTVDLDQHFDRVMQKYSGSSEMPPEQALVVGTLVAVAGPVAVHTDLPDRLREEVQD